MFIYLKKNIDIYILLKTNIRKYTILEKEMPFFVLFVLSLKREMMNNKEIDVVLYTKQFCKGELKRKTDV